MVMMLLRQFTVAEVGKAIGRPERWQCDGKYWRMDSMDDATQHSGLPELQPEDLRDLEYALELVDSPGLIARLSDLIGSPIEAMLKRLPDGAARIIDAASSKALWAALKVAAGSLPRHRASFVSHDRRHRILSGISGAVGGAFGLPALGIELPVTTTLIMRSIAEIAQCEGEDLRDPAVGMACMEVFAFGGEQPGDDATESGYFAVRAALARAVNEAAQYIGRQGSIREGAPLIARLLSRIASRFNTVVSEKILAEGVPVIGAVGGATINVLFMRHYQDMARGHFIIRHLERIYGPEPVRRQAALLHHQ